MGILSRLGGSVDAVLPKMGLSGPSAVMYTCKMSLLLLLLAGGCKSAKQVLKPGDAIYPNRCRAFVPDTTAEYRKDLLNILDSTRQINSQALETSPHAQQSMQEVFVYYNATTGRMDTTSLERAVGCLGFKADAFPTCSDLAGWIARFGYKERRNIQHMASFSDGVYLSISDASGHASTGTLVWPEETWIPVLPEEADTLDREPSALHSRMIIPDTLDPRELTATVVEGLDIQDSTRTSSAKYLSVHDKGRDMLYLMPGTPADAFFDSHLAFDHVVADAIGVSISMQSKRIPPQFDVVVPFDTTAEALEIAELVSLTTSWNAASEYRTSRQSSTLSRLGDVLTDIRQAYEVYNATCPESLNGYTMSGLSIDDITRMGLYARDELESQTRPYLEDPDPVVVTDTTQIPIENCSSLSNTNETFTISTTCDGEQIYAVTIVNATGHTVWENSHISAGETVNFAQQLAGQPSGLYYITVFGITSAFSDSFSVMH